MPSSTKHLFLCEMTHKYLTPWVDFEWPNLKAHIKYALTNPGVHLLV